MTVSRFLNEIWNIGTIDYVSEQFSILLLRLCNFILVFNITVYENLL